MRRVCLARNVRSVRNVLKLDRYLIFLAHYPVAVLSGFTLPTVKMNNLHPLFYGLHRGHFAIITPFELLKKKA